MDVDVLFQQLYPALYRYLHRLTGDPDVAEDVAQESFVRLLRQPLPEEEARPWLFTVATNLLRRTRG
jgi:RNA polymerase sigma-70 factor, ECF subfamily